MKIKWFGHACFLFTSAAGVKIITDPYKSGDPINYGEVNESADVVLISHEHFDHNYPAAVKGTPLIIKATGNSEAKGIKFKGIPVFHDDTNGSQRGKNTIFVFEIDGLRICHLGDLGHVPDKKLIADIGKVDIVFVPVGGLYTIDGNTATEVIAKLSPKVVIPMHFLTPKLDANKFGQVSGPENFLKGKNNIRRLDTSEFDISVDTLPAVTQIIVCKPAR
jgi:L-ascorbate metabolism protein UlaG (beta-lactamase superfamily)